MMKNPAVYILASSQNGTLYIGVTSDLIKRIWQHKEGLSDGFTKQYEVKILVWYEQHETMESAIAREKAMKKWLRKWKLTTIEKMNPNWIDLWPHIIGEAPLPVVLAASATPTPAPSIAAAPPIITAPFVIPAQAGIQQQSDTLLDSRLRGNDDVEDVA